MHLEHMAIHTHTLQPNPNTYADAQVIHSLVTLVVCTHYVRMHTLAHTPHPPTHRSNMVTSRTLTICTVSPLLSTTWEAGGASAAEEGTAQGRGLETVCDIKE